MSAKMSQRVFYIWVVIFGVADIWEGVIYDTCLYIYDYVWLGRAPVVVSPLERREMRNSWLDLGGT